MNVGTEISGFTKALFRINIAATLDEPPVFEEREGFTMGEWGYFGHTSADNSRESGSGFTVTHLASGMAAVKDLEYARDAQAAIRELIEQLDDKEIRWIGRGRAQADFIRQGNRVILKHLRYPLEIPPAVVRSQQSVVRVSREARGECRDHPCGGK